MQFLRRIQELLNQRNLVPPLKELHSKELIGEHVSNQLGHPEVTRTKVSQHLIPLHPSDRQTKLLVAFAFSSTGGRRGRDPWAATGTSGVRERNASVALCVRKWSCATVKIFVAAAACWAQCYGGLVSALRLPDSNCSPTSQIKNTKHKT